MSLPAPDSAELGFQVGDHVCAFYNGGNSLDDIVVDYVSKGLEAGDKCVCFIDTASSVRARVPARAAAKLGDHGDDLPLSCGTGVPPGFLVDLRAWRVPVSRM
jgi:hypothetical protein